MTVMTQRPSGPSRPGPGPAELVQMARIARRYYLEGMSKLAIAEELGLSRHKVARSLLKARESGVVRISVDFPDDTSTKEEELS
jgi:DNA-binding transcriptional regulator LsrR (DeoR family)